MIPALAFVERGQHFGDDMPFDASGTIIYGDGQNGYRVRRVVEGSPAAEAGLHRAMSFSKSMRPRATWGLEPPARVEWHVVAEVLPSLHEGEGWYHAKN